MMASDEHQTCTLLYEDINRLRIKTARDNYGVMACGKLEKWTEIHQNTSKLLNKYVQDKRYKY